MGRFTCSSDVSFNAVIVGGLVVFINLLFNQLIYLLHSMLFKYGNIYLFYHQFKLLQLSNIYRL